MHASTTDTVPVVVAAEDVPRRSKLLDSMLTTREYPRDLVPPGAVTRLEDARDQVTRTSLVKGEPVLKARLGVGLDTFIPRGMQAITIEQMGPFFYSAQNVDDLIDARVDVLLTLNDQ